jgi:hypothetical protein
MNGCRRGAVVALVLGSTLLALGLTGQWLGWGAYATGLLIGTGIGGLFAAAIMWWTPGSLHDSAPASLTRQYYRDFLPPMAAYVVVMVLWKRLLDVVDMSWLRILIALLPALLVLLVIRAMARYVRDADEMQRRIELESVAIAAAVVAAIYMTAGFLQSAGLIAIPAAAAMLWVYPLLCIGYGVVKIVIARRYA